MADFRTIAFIFAICMLADMLFRNFMGGSEHVQEPHTSENVNTHGFEPDVHTAEEKVYGSPSEDEFFSETTQPDDVQTIEPQVINVNSKADGFESRVRTINILYCIQ